MSDDAAYDRDEMNRHLDRIATALERALAPRAPTAGPYYPATWGEPRPSHWPVMPAQPRDLRPSTITT